MAEAEYEKTSYGAFERFVYLFFIPIIFTLILTYVLLTLFGYNVANTFLTLANKIPFIESVVPDPKVTEPDSGQKDPNIEKADLEILLKQAEENLIIQIEANEKKDIQIQELAKEISMLNEQLMNKTQTDDEYLIKIQQLAAVYAKMSPSKAAPILENLTLSELVLVLNEINQADQIKILEKMSPQKAAEASILLKDQWLVKDLQIAALQERLAIHSNDQPSTTLTNNELALTFASMTPNSAALVLLEMLNNNEVKVIEIMRAMEVQARSTILNVIAEISETKAANISTKLGE